MDRIEVASKLGVPFADKRLSYRFRVHPDGICFHGSSHQNFFGFAILILESAYGECPSPCKRLSKGEVGYGELPR